MVKQLKLTRPSPGESASNHARDGEEIGGPIALRRRSLLTQMLATTSTVAVLGPLGIAACSRLSAVSENSTPSLPASARVLAIGDSLTAGKGADASQSWPAELSRLTGWQVVNAGRNGDTSAGALTRLPALLREASYDAIIIAIGGNDMMRSVPQDATISSIRQMIQMARAASPLVALVATPRPDIWRASLRSLQDADFYAELAMQENVLLIPDTYTNVLNQPQLHSDQIHANARGYAEIAKRMAEQLAQAGWR